MGTDPHYPVSLTLLTEHPEIGMGHAIYVKGVIEQGMEGVDISDRRCPATCGMFLYFNDPSPTDAGKRLADSLLDAARRGKALEAVIQTQVIYKRRSGGPWKLRHLRFLGIVSLRVGPHLVANLGGFPPQADGPNVA
jgi:hypothetical protein